MCDYSVNIPNRLANTGDILTTYKLKTGTIGLVCETNLLETQKYQKKNYISKLLAKLFRYEEPILKAVCIPPSTQISISGIPKHVQEEMELPESSVVTFCQQDMEKQNTHHDSIQFPNGKTVLLQYLPSNIKFEILTTESTERVTSETMVRVAA